MSSTNFYFSVVVEIFQSKLQMRIPFNVDLSACPTCCQGASSWDYPCLYQFSAIPFNSDLSAENVNLMWTLEEKIRR